MKDKVNHSKVPSNLNTAKKERPSQQIMKEFLAVNKKNDGDEKYKNLLGYIFHLLTIVEDMGPDLDQLRRANLKEDAPKTIKENLQSVRKNCIAMAREQYKSLSKSLPEIDNYLMSLESDSKEEEEVSSTNRVLQTEEVDQVKKAAKEAGYKAVTMMELINKFIVDGTPLPVVEDKGFYTAPIKIVMKKDCSLNPLPVVHTKVLPTGKPEQEGGLPVIRYDISDESTFRCYPDLKNKIPHSSYRLFSSDFNRAMENRSEGIVELSGMKKIEGFQLGDEDLSEKEQKEMANLLQSGGQTSLAEVIKAQVKAGKAVTDIYVTEKANGAYAACQVFKSPDDETLLFVSAKASPLFLKIPEVGSVEEKKKKLIEELEELRQSVVRLDPLLDFIATESINQLSECALKGEDLFNLDHPFWKGGMCVGEAEQGNHIIPLTDAPKIRFFKQTGLDASVSIKDELDGLKKVGLCTVDHYSIGIEQLEAKEKEWRDSRDKEGFVVYYKVDGKVCQIKYKAIPYIILRALREFLNGNRGKECFGVPFNEKSVSAVLSLANRPEHVKQVIAYFLETHPHLQALCKNNKFSPIVEKNIEEYKKDIPQFIQYLLRNGYCEKDLGYDGDFGIGQLYKKFKEAGNVQAGERSCSFSGNFQGLIIAISGPPGIGKDAVAKKLFEHEDYNGKSVILSKDMAAAEVLHSPNSGSLSDKQKIQKRNEWLKGKIKEAVSNSDIIITTTCNGSSKELAWITDAAKQYNLAVVPVYPKISCKEDRTAFLAALIVSVLRRQDHPTLSASKGESLNGKFAEVIKDRVIKDFYTYASANENDRQKIPVRDFNDKCSPTQFLNYFDLSKFDAFLKKTGLSEEQTKIQNALLDVVKFIKNEEKEISKESLTALQEAKESEINQIFQRVKADNLRDVLMKKIDKLQEEGLHYQREKQDDSMSSNRQVNYYGAFLDDKAITMLREKVRATLEDVEKLPDWIKTYLTDKTTQLNSSGLKNDPKRVGVANRSSTHLTLAHANLSHKLSLEASTELEKMLAENEGNGAKVEIKVKEICYNEGVLYASGVRVLCKGDDKTASLVASGVPHITLANRPGIGPVYALFAEKARVTSTRPPLEIKTIDFEKTEILTAKVGINYKNISICNKKKGQQTSVNSFFAPATSFAQARQSDEVSPSVRMKPN